jgi:hypothetical protein
MIPRNMTFDDLHITRLTNLADQIPCPLCSIDSQYGLAVFRDSYDVKFDVVYRMARLPVILHTASLLKSSPEGEGFSPIPRRGQ